MSTRVSKTPSILTKRAYIQRIRTALQSRIDQDAFGLSDKLLQWEQDICLDVVATKDELGYDEAQVMADLVNELGREWLMTT